MSIFLRVYDYSLFSIPFNVLRCLPVSEVTDPALKSRASLTEWGRVFVRKDERGQMWSGRISSHVYHGRVIIMTMRICNNILAVIHRV